MQSGAAGAECKKNTAILTVSIGAEAEYIGGKSGRKECSSRKENCGGNETLDALGRAFQKEFPDCEVRKAFTGRRDAGVPETVLGKVLEKAAADGIDHLVVQPMYLMEGYKYADLAKLLDRYKEKFDLIALGRPLLSSDEDFTAVAKAITEKTAEYDDGRTAICFVGHGTEAAANMVYRKMQEVLWNGGYENYYIGTVKAEPSFKTVAETIRKKGIYERVVLSPLMIGAGAHARSDIAGEKTDSWKALLQRAGYAVAYLPGGLGEIPAVRDLFVKHAGEALTAISSGSLWG